MAKLNHILWWPEVLWTTLKTFAQSEAEMVSPEQKYYQLMLKAAFYGGQSLKKTIKTLLDHEDPDTDHEDLFCWHTVDAGIDSGWFWWWAIKLPWPYVISLRSYESLMFSIYHCSAPYRPIWMKFSLVNLTYASLSTPSLVMFDSS